MMEALELALSQIDFSKYPCLSDHPRYKEISVLCERAYENESDKLPDSVLLLRYNTHLITSPKLQIEHIPVLLALLTQLEVIRNELRKTTRKEFLHVTVSSRNGELRVSKGPEEELARQDDESEGCRGIFWAIIVSCVQLYLRHLAAVGSVTDFWCYFNEYLPFYNNPERERRFFHYAMNAEEEDELREAAKLCLTSIVKAKSQNLSAESIVESLEREAEQLPEQIYFYVDSILKYSTAMKAAKGWD